MRLIFIFFICIVITQKAISQVDTVQGGQNDASSSIDSLSFIYDVKKILILLDGEPVHYSVIFQEGKNIEKRYKFMQGAMDPIDAIRRYGERYRYGLLMYKDEKNERNK